MHITKIIRSTTYCLSFKYEQIQVESSISKILAVFKVVACYHLAYLKKRST